MMGSLNEGVELDNEVIDTGKEAGKILDQALFTEVVPGETPELAPEVDILGMVSKLRDLDYAQINLQQIAGMNQEMAVEMFPLVPALISDECPVGFYSKGITKVRYNYALEAIDQEKTATSSKIKEAIVKAIAWVREQLKKLVDWFKARIDEHLKKEPPKDVGGLDRRAVYVSAFGQDDGEKLYAALTGPLESRDKRIKHVTADVASNFYFVSGYKKTPFFNKFLSFIDQFMKDLNKVVYESEKFKKDLASPSADFEQRRQSLEQIANDISGIIDFFRESAQTYPENSNGEHDQKLSEAEAAKLMYPQVREVYERVVVGITKHAALLIKLTTNLESILAETMEAIANSSAPQTSATAERIFVDLIKNYSRASREVMTDIVRWNTQLMDCSHRMATAYASDTFKSQEAQACKRLGLNYEKIA